MIPLTKKEEKNYNNQKICYICKKEFDKSDKKHYKVRDHCHYTGIYRGAAHNICKLRKSQYYFIMVPPMITIS